jgi:hypothetical protein
MNDKTGVFSKCPDQEELSAWLDGQNGQGVEQHISECLDCREKVEFYQRIDTALQSRTQPADDLVWRIEKTCAELVAAPAPRLWIVQWAPRLLRIAAIFAFICAVALMTKLMNSGAEDQSQAVAINSNQQVPKTAPQTVIENEEVTFGVANNGRPDLYSERDLRLVTPEDQLQRALREAVQEQPQLAVLPESVHHVWVVENLADSRRLLEQHLPAEAAWLCATKKDRAMCFRISLSDQLLQGLVDQLQAAGWALVTPGLPQPGETERLLVTGKKIVYVADVVLR